MTENNNKQPFLDSVDQEYYELAKEMLQTGMNQEDATLAVDTIKDMLESKFLQEYLEVQNDPRMYRCDTCENYGRCGVCSDCSEGSFWSFNRNFDDYDKKDFEEWKLVKKTMIAIQKMREKQQKQLWLLWISNDNVEPLLVGAATSEKNAALMKQRLIDEFGDIAEYSITNIMSDTLIINDKEIKFGW